MFVSLLNHLLVSSLKVKFQLSQYLISIMKISTKASTQISTGKNRVRVEVDAHKLQMVWYMWRSEIQYYNKIWPKRDIYSIVSASHNRNHVITFQDRHLCLLISLKMISRAHVLSGACNLEQLAPEWTKKYQDCDQTQWNSEFRRGGLVLAWRDLPPFWSWRSGAGTKNGHILRK